MQRGVGVLLRVHHPDQQVGALHQALRAHAVLGHDRVVVGQVEQDEAGGVTGRGAPAEGTAG